MCHIGAIELTPLFRQQGLWSLFPVLTAAMSVRSSSSASTAPAQQDAVAWPATRPLCVRLSLSLWLWIAASRRLGQVLGLALGQRDRSTLTLCWSDVPEGYRNNPVLTNGVETYRSFFYKEQHRALEKGSGEISIVESLNTKWRQRQPGLIHRSCGVSRRIKTDLMERFFLLVEQHNQSCVRKAKQPQPATLSSQ